MDDAWQFHASFREKVDMSSSIKRLQTDELPERTHFIV